MPDEKLLDGIQAIAKELGVPARSVQHMIDAHGMPVIRLGRRIYGRKSTLMAWLAECEAAGRQAQRESAA